MSTQNSTAESRAILATSKWLVKKGFAKEGLFFKKVNGISVGYFSVNGIPFSCIAGDPEPFCFEVRKDDPETFVKIINALKGE